MAWGRLDPRQRCSVVCHVWRGVATHTDGRAAGSRPLPDQDALGDRRPGVGRIDRIDLVDLVDRADRVVTQAVLDHLEG